MVTSELARYTYQRIRLRRWWWWWWRRRRRCIHVHARRQLLVWWSIALLRWTTVKLGRWGFRIELIGLHEWVWTLWHALM